MGYKDYSGTRRAAGVFLLIPLYPIALIGLLCKLDDMLTSFVRGWR